MAPSITIYLFSAVFLMVSEDIYVRLMPFLKMIRDKSFIELLERLYTNTS